MKKIVSFILKKLSPPVWILLVVTACSQPAIQPQKNVKKQTNTVLQTNVEPEKSNAKFTLVKVQKADSFASLAKKYLNDSSKDWRIREFNQIEKLVPGKTLLVPKQSITFGGISSAGFQTVPVLRYMKINKKIFEKQMKFLQTNGYRPISMAQFADFLEFKLQIPSRAVVITIDDNSSSVFKSIYPILKKYNYHATIFLDTKQIERKKKNLKWEQVEEMSNNGIDIQCQPTKNRDWTRLGKKEKFDKFFNSMNEAFYQPREILQKKLGKVCDFIAYPKGKTNFLISSLIKKLGYRGGFSLAGWANPFFVDPFGISRFAVVKDYKEEKFIGILNNFRPYSKGGKQELGLPLPKDDNNLLLHYQSLGKQLSEKRDYPRSLLSWEVAAELDQKKTEAEKTILIINQQIKKQTQIHYKNAKNLRKKRKINKARIEFLKGLYNDPKHKKALYYVTNRMREREYTVYKIKKADTLLGIAKKEYKDEDKGFLIAFFNKPETIKNMKPGEILVLPKLTSEFMKASYDAKIDLAQAKAFAAEKKYEKAVAIYEKILTNEPTNKQAIALKNLSYQKLGQKLALEKKLLLSKRAYEKVDSNSPGIKRILKKLVKEIAALAEAQYKVGIEFFIDEKLKKAINSWKETLRLNPLHPKAAIDLKRATNLLQKLQNL